MSDSVDEVGAAAATFDRAGMADDRAQAQGERERVLAEFPLAEWSNLSLRRYALGMGPAREQMTYCRLMEFGTPLLGSIRGGSAGKHIMFRHRSGDWRLAAPLRGMDPEDAWERLRAQFVSAFNSVSRGDFDAADELDLLLFGQALVTKSLATYFPEHFLPIYSGTHLRHFIKLLGSTPERDAPTWRLNRRLRTLLMGRPELDGWSEHELRIFLYKKFDPRVRRGEIWKIAPGPQGSLWKECLDEKVIRVSWDEVGDLGQYESDADLKRALNDQSGGGSVTTARRLLAFRDLEPGDVIVANKGTTEVLGVGTVSDGYYYDPDRSEYRHVVPVVWDTSVAAVLDKPQHGWRSTFAKLSSTTFAEIIPGASRIGGTPAGNLDASPSTAVVPEEVQRILDALERKGQVILHGPPGTGKTRLALSAALALCGRTEALAGDTAVRNSAFEELSGNGQVRLVTFHPSYGYEDFVEGFKPDVASNGSGLTLKLSDGVFHSLCSTATRQPDQTFLLIVDEINRGDLPRILGELLTFLEMDKRGLSVTLPISKRSFAVPTNIRIIGTMNTADRSISHLDAAVRRRFAFLHVGPDPDAVAGTVGPLDLAVFLEQLNERITDHLDADHQLGHAYLLFEDEPVATEEALAAAFAHDILPLLEDHCLGRAELLRDILGDLINAENGELVRMAPQDLVAALAAEFTAAQRVDTDA